LSDGTVRCWGNNANGQLGDGSATNRALPVMVKNPAGNGTLTKVTQISIRGVSSCARPSDGTARCWGNNANGQLGDGTTTGGPPRRRQGPDGNGLLTGVTQVAPVDNRAHG
jgi:alpha-tubulin suppressor-like RCC1 family protein